MKLGLQDWFVRYAANPTLCNLVTSPLLPMEVIITNKVSLSIRSTFIILPRASPSVPGRSMSRMAIWNEWPVVEAERNFSKAEGPSNASSYRQFHDWSILQTIRRLVELPSTTSTRLPARPMWPSASLPVSIFCLVSGRVNQKVEPFPSLLSTPIWPPIILTNCFEIESPRPVPPCLRVVEESTWVKGWKRGRLL